MYEVFEHTADLGLRVRAADLNTLFVDAARALFSTIVEEPNTIQPLREVHVDLEDDDPTYLLFDWLNELLYQFECKHFVLSRFAVELHGKRLHGTAWGEPIDRARHVLDHEVKAITYHALSVRQTDVGWEAEIIVDI